MAQMKWNLFCCDFFFSNWASSIWLDIWISFLRVDESQKRRMILKTSMSAWIRHQASRIRFEPWGLSWWKMINLHYFSSCFLSSSISPMQYYDPPRFNSRFGYFWKLLESVESSEKKLWRITRCGHVIQTWDVNMSAKTKGLWLSSSRLSSLHFLLSRPIHLNQLSAY